jgi:hypothetical protein
MSFSLVVKFTGICTLVPNHDKSKYYIVMPDGDRKDNKQSTGADGKDLKRHRAFVRFKIKDLALAQGKIRADDSIQAILYFRKRIEEGGTTDDSGCELSFNCSGAADSLKVGNLSHIPSLEDFAPGYCAIDPLIVTRPVPERVVGRVLIDKGTLAECGAPSDWIIMNTLNPNTLLQDPKLNPQLTSGVLWQMDGLDSLELAMTPFGRGIQEIFAFQAEEGKTVEITVANLCDDNPLLWGPTATSQADLDFRWHYELLHPDKRQMLVTLLDGRDLPFPIPKRTGGVGINCLQTRATSPVNF